MIKILLTRNFDDHDTRTQREWFFPRRRLEKCVGLTSEFTAYYEKADAAEGSKLHPGTGQANFYPGYAQKCGFSSRLPRKKQFIL